MLVVPSIEGLFDARAETHNLILRVAEDPHRARLRGQAGVEEETLGLLERLPRPHQLTMRSPEAASLLIVLESVDANPSAPVTAAAT